MSLFKPLRYNYLRTLLKPSFLLSQNLYTTPQTTPINEQTQKTKKPLHLLFTEAVGLSQKKPDHDSDVEDSNELKKSLRKLEQQVRKLKEHNQVLNENNQSPVVNIEKAKKGKQKKPERLYNLFAENKGYNGGRIRDLEEDPSVYRPLSPDLAKFVEYLYEEGYFRDANFVAGDKFDVNLFESSYARMFIQSAAQRFGKDKQDIAKWVSASDLRKVALFGCPSLGKKNIFTTKKLRSFFKIHEPKVCSKCTLKTSCKFPDQGVWKHDTNNLDLGVVMRVITLYALGSTHPQLVVTEEIKNSVGHLLKEIMNLSRTSA